MKRTWTPTRRVWLRALVVGGMTLLAAPALAATCPEVKFGGPASLTVPDFDPVIGGGWAAHQVTVNGQPSSPNPSQGGAYQWTQLSGPAVTLVNASTPKVEFTAPDVGSAGATVVLRLTVTGCGSSASGNYTVNITDAHDVVVNAPPHAAAIATPSSAHEGELVTLDGSTSWDPDGNPLSYVWTQVEGPTVVLANANLAQTSFVAPNVAATTTLKFRLTVSDGTLQNSTDVLVNALWTNDPPITALGCPSDVNEGATVTLDGSGSSDSDDGIVSYAWLQLAALPEVPGVNAWNTPSVGFNAPSLGYEQTGLVPFELTVTDASGAADSATCYVFIHDVTAPIISGAQDISAEATSSAGATVAYALSALDAVDGDLTSLLACVPPAGPFAFGTTQVNCSVHDSAENLASAVFNVTVADTTAPVITAPLSVAVEATGPNGAVATFEATTFDAVDGDGVAECSPPSGSQFPVDDSTVTCTATDSHGNAASPAYIAIHVLDTQAPELTLPSPQTLEATSPTGAVATFSATATDIVDGNVAVSCDRNSGDTFALGTTTVHCQAGDAHGNVGSGEFAITVQDTTPPAITNVSANLTAEATSAAGAAVNFTGPTATDLVDGTVAVTCAPAAGSTFALGTTTVTCSASDTHANTASASFAITVVDTTPPTINNVSDNLTVEATSAAGAAVSYALPNASDLVDGNVAVSCAPASGSTLALGYHTVTCTATDAHGNSASAAFGVHVVDTTAPVIYYPGDINATAGSNSTAVVTYPQPTAWDVVDGAVEVTCTPASGSTFPVGSNIVNCSASDRHGNTASGSFNVSVSYAWTGFFRPVDMAPVVNVAKAGSAVPLKFSLGGNQGMSIMAAGYPKSAPMACGGSVEDPLLETVTAGASSLQYDASANQYIYVWKSEKSWAGSCRQLQIKLSDGTLHTASFSFK